MIFIIVIILAIILGIIIIYSINSLKEVKVYKGKIPILITSEEEKIMEFYNNTEKVPLKISEMVDLEIVGEAVLKFNDGNTIILDKSSDGYAYLKNKEQGYLMHISLEFYNYIFSII